MYRSWSISQKLSLMVFWKSFFWSEYILYSILMSSKKKLKNYWVWFFDSRSRSTHFWHMLCISKMFFGLSGIFWCQLEHYLKHLPSYMAGKRKNFRFCQNDTPKSVEYSVLFEAISVNSLTLEPCKSFLMCSMTAKHIAVAPPWSDLHVDMKIIIVRQVEVT